MFFLQDPQFLKTLTTDGNDFINTRDFTLHEIGCHCFVEKELQLFCDARHESLCYNENGRLIRCNKFYQDFSPIDLVDNTLRKKVNELGGVYHQPHQVVSLPRLSRTNCFRDELN